MFGQRLRLARKRAGLSMRGLASMMNPQISAQAISKYESGKMFPSSTVLIGLREVLGVSLDYLLSQRLDAIDSIEFRKHSRASAVDRANAEVILIDRLENYLAIELILDISPDTEWIKHYSLDYIEDETEVGKIADALRDNWNLGTHPIPSMSGLLETNGIKVIEAKLPNSISGLSCQALRKGEVVAEAILISNSIGIEHKRFTFAHELAHRLIRATNNPEIKLERVMDRFAGIFLVPDERLRREVGDKRSQISYYEIMQLKHMFGVSAMTILKRLDQTGILSASASNNAFKPFIRSWRNSEPEPIMADQGFGSPEEPRRFNQLVLNALGEHVISLARATQLLGKTIDEVELMFDGPTAQ